ncbi:hypothetical protein HHI36_023095 [Cryptolaemus montrouzieri]
MMLKFFLDVALVVTLLIELSTSWRDTQPRVKLRQGIIEGMKLITEFSQLRVFFGVPYAAAPLGSLRFAAPRKHQGWNGTYQAKNTKPGCPQLPILPENENEDCLYLDIWAPENNSSYQFPVVVFFGGVDFARESKLIFDGQELASKGLIVIRVTYRLNIFGFMCLESPELRGNIGLLDQYYALVWVKENVVYFGGNQANITLFGHFSGATSVALHMTSSRTSGLFQRVVLSSGSATAPWITDNDTIQISKQLVRILRCDANTVMCLRGKSVRELLQALQIYSESVNKTSLLLPIVDNFLQAENRYLAVSAINSFREGVHVQIPTLVGIGWPIRYPEVDEWINLLSQGYFFLQKYVEKVKIPELIKLYRLDEKVQDLITNLLEWEYSLFIDADGRFLVNQLRKMEYEAKIEAPTFHQVSLISQRSKQPVYVYCVEDIDIVSDLVDESITMDLVLFMGSISASQISRRKFSPKEVMLSKELQDCLVNFIIFG